MNRDEILNQIIPAMTMAPSAHNTQPWLFKVDNNLIDIYIDPKRHLSVSDPTLRQLYISIGCAVTNGVVAAANADYRADIQFFPEGDADKAPVVRLQLHQGQPDQHAAELFDAIGRRYTDRSLYSGKPLKSEHRSAIPSAHHDSVVILEDPEQLKELVAITGQGSFDTLARRDFRHELSGWLRNNWTKKSDGMPGYALLMPGIMSLALPLAVRHLPIHKFEQTNTGKQMSTASAALIFCGETDEPLEWLRVGQRLEYTWLEAIKTGIAVAPMAAAVESNKASRNKLQQLLGINLLPHAIVRVGYSTKNNLKASPRRKVDDCLF